MSPRELIEHGRGRSDRVPVGAAVHTTCEPEVWKPEPERVRGLPNPTISGGRGLLGTDPEKGVFRLDQEVRELLEDYVRVRGARLVRTAFLISGDPQLAEDLVQSALASVIASWQRLPDVADLDAYLFRSIVNARHRWWRRRSSAEIPVESLPVASVDDGTDRFARHADMVAVLRSLPPKQRAAVVLRYYEDLSEAQAAMVLGCSVGTIKSQTSDGLAKLRAALGVDPTGRRRLARGAGEIR